MPGQRGLRPVPHPCRKPESLPGQGTAPRHEAWPEAWQQARSCLLLPMVRLSTLHRTGSQSTSLPHRPTVTRPPAHAVPRAFCRCRTTAPTTEIPACGTPGAGVDEERVGCWGCSSARPQQGQSWVSRGVYCRRRGRRRLCLTPTLPEQPGAQRAAGCLQADEGTHKYLSGKTEVGCSGFHRRCLSHGQSRRHSQDRYSLPSTIF